MPHHLLRNHQIIIYLPIMNLKFESHEVRQDGRGTRLRFDWGGFLAGFRTDDGKAVGREVERSVTDPWGARSLREGDK